MSHFTLVIWGDAHQTLDQKTLAEVKARHRPDPIYTQGYVVYEDEVGISIAGETLPVTNGDVEESYRLITFIPKGMIVSREDIRKPVKRKKKVKAAATADAGAAATSVPEA